MVHEQQREDHSVESASEDFTGSPTVLASPASPGDLVVLTRERIEATLLDSAARGEMTRGVAAELAALLLERGRITRSDLPADVERARRDADREASAAPIPDYDELTAAQLSGRVAQLDPGQLRLLREHELRNANRKSVLAAVDQRLG